MFFLFFYLAIAVASAVCAVIAALHPSPYVMPAAVGFGLLAAWAVWRVLDDESPKPWRRTKPVLKLGGYSWSERDFCRGWLITGATGSGKTLGAINPLLWQITQNCPGWGGLLIDDKGFYRETLSAMFRHSGREKDLVFLQVRPGGAPSSWTPPDTFNFLDDSRLSWSAKAKEVCAVAVALGIRPDGNQPIVPEQVRQAESRMEFAFRVLACAGLPVTLACAHELFASDSLMARIIERLEGEDPDEARLLKKQCEAQAGSRLSEPERTLRGLLCAWLKPFVTPEIARVFCPEKESTVSLKSIDRGKVICVSIPQRFGPERRFVHTLLKRLFYSHALMRFDCLAEERRHNNLLVLWADEAQKILPSCDDGTSDYNQLEVMREARVSMVEAVPSCSSLVAPGGGDGNTVAAFLAGHANRVTFRAANEESARITAEWCHPDPDELCQLGKFEAIVQHCETMPAFRRVTLPPRGADGETPEWYR